MRKSDKLLWKSGDVIISPCLDCKHWRGKRLCSAFPNGVPAAILSGENKHISPYPGDNGIQYEPLKK